MNFAETIRQAVMYHIGNIHTCIPAQVESYNAPRARIKPLIKRVYADGDVVAIPVIPNVPVQFPRSSTAGMKFKLKKGDTGMLFFAERSLERWLALGGDQEPGMPRMHDLSDAVFIPGVQPFNVTDSQPDSDLLVYAGDVKVKLDQGKIALGTQAVELVDVLSQTLMKLSVATVSGVPLSNAAEFASLQVQLETIKGTL